MHDVIVAKSAVTSNTSNTSNRIGRDTEIVALIHFIVLYINLAAMASPSVASTVRAGVKRCRGSNTVACIKRTYATAYSQPAASTASEAEVNSARTYCADLLR